MNAIKITGKRIARNISTDLNKLLLKNTRAVCRADSIRLSIAKTRTSVSGFGGEVKSAAATDVDASERNWVLHGVCAFVRAKGPSYRVQIAQTASNRFTKYTAQAVGKRLPMRFAKHVRDGGCGVSFGSNKWLSDKPGKDDSAGCSNFSNRQRSRRGCDQVAQNPSSCPRPIIRVGTSQTQRAYGSFATKLQS